MARAQLVGSRIRGLRMDRGLKQTELAARCDISASYLNLIEHNRRKIAGALLNRLARVLEVDPADLSEGAASALTEAIENAAARHPDLGVELDRVDDFAGRFPGWARLVEIQNQEVSRLERVVEGLNDRLTHDPFLSASLHDVLSSVTAIRSASAILADGGEIAPEWQARFHRNILEDSRRLAQSTERLVSYLDAGAEIERGISLPQEDVETWLENAGWAFPQLDADPETDIDEMVDSAVQLQSSASRHLARAYLRQYAEDARIVDIAELRDIVGRSRVDPAEIADRFGTSLPVVFRRLATLSEDSFADGQARGLVACDGSGTLTFRKPLPGFEVPRYGAGCPLWSLFQALHRPMQPLRHLLTTSGRDSRLFTAWAIAEARYPGGFEGPTVVEAWMLLEPRQGASAEDHTIAVGASCRICARNGCAARREPALLSAAVDA